MIMSTRLAIIAAAVLGLAACDQVQAPRTAAPISGTDRGNADNAQRAQTDAATHSAPVSAGTPSFIGSSGGEGRGRQVFERTGEGQGNLSTGTPLEQRPRQSRN